MEKTSAAVTPVDLEETVHTFRGEWDEEGMFFYQAYNDGTCQCGISSIWASDGRYLFSCNSRYRELGHG